MNVSQILICENLSSNSNLLPPSEPPPPPPEEESDQETEAHKPSFCSGEINPLKKKPAVLPRKKGLLSSFGTVSPSMKMKEAEEDSLSSPFGTVSSTIERTETKEDPLSYPFGRVSPSIERKEAKEDSLSYPFGTVSPRKEANDFCLNEGNIQKKRESIRKNDHLPTSYGSSIGSTGSSYLGGTSVVSGNDLYKAQVGFILVLLKYIYLYLLRMFFTLF